MRSTHYQRRDLGTLTATGPRHARHSAWIATLVVIAVAVGAGMPLTRGASVAHVGTRETSVPASAAPNPVGLFTSFDKRRSHNGRFAAAVIATTPAASSARQSWTIHLTRRSRRVVHAQLTLDVWMPETGRRQLVRPTVRYVGGGNYRVDSLSFPSPGWWNVALVIEGRFGTDSLAFNLVLPPHRRAASPSPSPTKWDLMERGESSPWMVGGLRRHWGGVSDVTTNGNVMWRHPRDDARRP